jgi:intein-encoded DNA endonuclease-like protein
VFALNEDLFYLIGALRDGSVHYDHASRNYYTVWYSSNIRYLKVSILPRVLKVFNKNVDIYEYKKGHFRVRVAGKAIHDFIKEYFEFPKDGVGQINWGVPDALQNTNLNSKCAYIRGMFDAEGDVSPSNRYIEVSQQNTEILKWIKSVLSSLDIQSGNVIIADRKSLTYKIVVASKRGLANFKISIGFEYPEKNKLLDSLIKNLN